MDDTSSVCAPCSARVPPLRNGDLTKRFSQLGSDWRLVDDHHLEKEFRFRNFREALAFTTRVGNLAEEHGHHPDIYLSWGLVRIQTWSHKSNGLTESDFVLAAHIDGLSPAPERSELPAR